MCNRYHVAWSLENPKTSRLFDVPVLSQLIHGLGVHEVCLDFCRFGERYKKPTIFFLPCMRSTSCSVRVAIDDMMLF